LRTALVELRAAKREPVDLEIERRRPRRTAIGVNYGRTIDFEDPSKPFEPSKPDDVLELLSATSLPDVVSLDFVFRNDGELTIRAPAVELRETRNERIFDEGLVRVKPIPVRLKLEDAIVYPGDEQTINGAQLSLEIKREVFAGGDYAMSWKVFLDNSPPSFGEIDLASLIEPARRQGIR
jgi:hypothetical protein